MTAKPTKLSNKSRMFNSIVLMGSGLALGCGGVAAVPGSGAGGSSTASQGGSGSNSAGGPSAAGAGGELISTHPGGAPGTAGSGGSAGAPDKPLPCPPSQWTCATDQAECTIKGGFALGSSCKCDLHRPATAADCAPGQSFVCIEATRDAHGNPLLDHTPYECSCRPAAESCNAACDDAYGAARFGCYFGSGSDILCHCETAVILK